MTEMHIEPWGIRCESAVNDFQQSIFSLGNGTLGVRGFGAWEVKQNPQEHAIFRAGLFDEIKPGITDMVQLPDALPLSLQGELPDIVRQSLDLRKGILTHAWQGERATVRMERAVSMDDKGLILQRITVLAKESGSFSVHSIANAAVRNVPVHDDQMIASTEMIKLLEIDELNEQTLRMHTVSGGDPVEFRWEHHSDRNAQIATEIKQETATTCLTAVLEAGQSWTVEKRLHVLVRGEMVKPETPDPWEAHGSAWAALWRECDIELEGDDELQGAVRYNIFQMLCNNAAEDRTVSIGARGLTHGRYKGNTFWDTEIFILPFFLWTRPHAAKNLLLYRADRFHMARELAKRQNLEGARYPWMSSVDGKEQCESWDIGLCETHVTADIAYALDRYLQVAEDRDFSISGEIFLETARYWKSRFTWEPAKQQYSSFFVKGPDEYCGAAINNTFTNYMARHNIRLALEHAVLSPQEKQRLAHVETHIAILYDEQRDLYLQDELLERMEEAPFLKQGDEPLYKQVCFDRMQRYKVLKQADLVLLMTLFPNDFTQDQKRNVFSYYEPITLHDSTLSYGVHAQLALQLDLQDTAWHYLQKAVFLDLKDVMGNTGQEGLHMAAFGSAWQALVFGAAGLWNQDSKPVLRPHLPKQIQKLRFRVRCGKKRYLIEVTHGAASMTEEV